MSGFAAFGLPETTVRALAALKFAVPTPIQEAVIPLALRGKDILGSAQTGTGKTAAFGLPLAAMLEMDRDATALILAPTRELATQIHDALRTFLGQDSRHRSALLIGGEPYFKQISALKGRPRFIAGTPGRILDHHRRGTLKPGSVRMLVLDEMDRMLDLGFDEQIETIVGTLPAARQTMMFSATMPREVEARAARYLRDPERIAVSGVNIAAASIRQRMVQTRANEKYETLLAELVTAPGTVIVFVKTKMGAEELSAALNEEGVSATALHGDLKQRQRDAVIRKMRTGRGRVLVATDVAARGLDIQNVAKVINYDLPVNPEDYVHRIGRTGRAGAEGEAVSFVSPAEKGKWAAIQRILNPGEAPKHNKVRPGYSGAERSRPRQKSHPESSPEFRADSRPGRLAAKGRAHPEGKKPYWNGGKQGEGAAWPKKPAPAPEFHQESSPEYRADSRPGRPAAKDRAHPDGKKPYWNGGKQSEGAAWPKKPAPARKFAGEQKNKQKFNGRSGQKNNIQKNNVESKPDGGFQTFRRPRRKQDAA